MSEPVFLVDLENHIITKEDKELVSVIPWPTDYEPTSFVRWTVGSNFRSSDGNTYHCVAYEPRWGFWMVQTNAKDSQKPRVTNVSERAIGRTFHELR